MSKPTKAQNPDMDFGFYAGIPRIVRTEYKEVSPVQKWLYVCLKDLAGDDGTCYRTIRALVEETGLSAGLISESIPALHKAGLIHAEKKKRHTGGKEVWHITIVDIWKKNGETHPTKRSPHEQTTGKPDVHQMNVHTANNKSTECSPDEHKRSQGEQECSRGETEERTISRPVSKNSIEARTEGTSREDHADTGSLHSPTPALSLIATETPTTEDEHDNTTGHNQLPARSHSGHNDSGSDSHSQGTAGNPHGTTLTKPQVTSERGDHSTQAASQRGGGEDTRPGSTPPVAPDSNGYENDDTQKRPAVRVPAQQLSTSVPQSGKVSAHVEPKQGRKSKKTNEPEPITLSPEAEKIWRAWCSLFTVEVELIPSNAAAAEKLVKPARAWCSKLHWSLAEWLGSIKDNAYEADSKGYYRKRGVKLFDIPRELEGWQSAKEHELSTLAQAAAPKPTTPPPVNPTLASMRKLRLHYTGGMS